LTIAGVARRGVQVEIGDSAMTLIMEAPEDEAEDIEGAGRREEDTSSEFLARMGFVLLAY
jgi:hypothetical protein